MPSVRSEVDVFVGTYNVNAKVVDEYDADAVSSMRAWLDWGKLGGQNQPALYVIGMQEVVALKATEMLSVSPENLHRWQSLCLHVLNTNTVTAAVSGGVPVGYSCVSSQQLVGIVLMVFARADAAPYIR